MANAAGQSCRDFTPPGGETLEQVRFCYTQTQEQYPFHQFDTFNLGFGLSAFFVQQRHAVVLIESSTQQQNG